MKMKWCVVGFLTLSLLAAFSSESQQSDADRKQFVETKEKAEAGNVSAQYELGAMYETGKGVLQWPLDAVKWYRKAAEQGNAEAQFRLGNMYLTCDRIAKDPEVAVKWLNLSAGQGNTNAQSLLRKIEKKKSDEYEQQLYKRQQKWERLDLSHPNLRETAENGDKKAQFKIGVIFHEGDGVPKDDDEAFYWFLSAAKQDVAEAQYNVGLFFDKGIGRQRDDREAVKWYSKSAEQGYPPAQYGLSIHYRVGAGIDKDPNKAVKLCEEAAMHGDANAQFALAGFFFYGNGKIVDYAEAVKWNALAAAQGNEDAVKLWNYVLKEKVSANDIAEGQRRAREFVPHKEGPGSNVSSISPSPVMPSAPQMAGTGFFITGDGYLISNQHVVKSATKIRIVTSAGTVEAKVIQTDAANDLALLKAEGRFAALPISPSRKVALGNTVATVGFPDPGLQGFAPKLAKGEIASLSGAGDDARYFQISVPVQPGNSGGALVDAHGNVVGIVSAKLNAAAALQSSGSLPENVNYAVKSSYLLSFLESVPDVASKLKDPLAADRKFEDVVKSAQDAAVLVLVY